MNPDLEAKINAVGPRLVLALRLVLAALVALSVISLTPAAIGAVALAFEAVVGVPQTWLTTRAGKRNVARATAVGYDEAAEHVEAARAATAASIAERRARRGA